MIRFLDVSTRAFVELADDARVIWMPRAWEQILASDGGLGEHPCLAQEIQPGQRCTFGDRLLAYHSSTERSACGWPFVPSKLRPGEMTIACGVCGSTDIVESVQYPARGTGPMGCGRLGDPGAVEYAKCNACGARANFPDKEGL